jgi:hypothetical protein
LLSAFLSADERGKMVSNLIPPDINCPRRRDLVSNGQWKYLFVVLGSTVPEPDGTFRYRTAYMKVEETMNLKEATFRWSLSDPNTFTYWQLLSQCGLGPRPCIRICVYRQGSHTRGLRTWHQPAEAFRLLGLGYVAQKRQRKTSWDRFCYAEGRRVTRSMSAMPLLPMAPQQRAPAAYGTAAAPPPMFELSIQGAVSRYSMAEALGFGGFATVKLLQLVGGPAGAPQQLACKQVNWPNPQSALDREAELLHLLHPTPSVIGYYGSYCGGLVLEYCSQGSLSSYCGNLIRQMEAEEATANPAAGIARQAKQEAMFTRSMWRDHDQFVAFKRGVSPAYEDGACTGGICARWKRWYEEEATEVLQTACFLETPVRDLMRDAFGCLAHLHSGTAIPGHPGAVVTNNDLKPSNLLVAADGSVRLADWGTGHVAGGTVTLAGTLPREHTTL